MTRLLKAHYLWICIIGFAISVFFNFSESIEFLKGHESACKTISTILSSLSISLFISVFVINQIQLEDKNNERAKDELVRQDFLKNVQTKIDQLNKSVFEHTLSTFVDRKVFDAFKSNLSLEGITEKADWTFTFKSVENKIILTQVLNYEVENDSEIGVSDNIELTTFDLKYYVSNIKEILINGNQRLTPTKSSNNNQVHFEASFTYPAKSRTQVQITTECIYNHTEIYGTYTLRKPLNGLNFEAIYPDGYDFIYGNTFNGQGVTKVKTANHTKVEFKSAILSGQSLQFFLVKK